ncbi:Ribonuclease P protein component [Candidatus Tremblaya princeps]|uniref:Ribonuclease P protein component n=1 Tax=Tremblaya princeps TaxID=189385 RepID=A0A143WNS0_TREPR|nr:Ribonuclease P protein component [Candidatus Tremblaya princeps]
MSFCAGFERGAPGLRRSPARASQPVSTCAPLRGIGAQYLCIARGAALRGAFVLKRHVRSACARNRVIRTVAWLMRQNLGAMRYAAWRAAPCVALACGPCLLGELAMDLRERMLRERHCVR